MSPTRRRKNISISQKLIENPEQYGFYQAVRLLERISRMADRGTTSDKRDRLHSNPVARFVPSSSEVIRFHTNQTLRFSSAEIAKISNKLKKSTSNSSDNSASNNSAPHKNQPWHVFVNFMGLTGTQGVLLYHYTELILQRQKLKDDTLKNFLDLFNHRTISLFYQSATKYHLPIEYERKKLNPPAMAKRDPHTQVLLSLIGLGTEHLDNRLYTRDESLLYYSGLFSHQIRTTSGLKQILQHHFSIPISIQEFVGQWQELIDDVRSRLSTKENPLGQNISLGKSVMLGHKGWFAQGKIRIILRPQSKKQAQKFALNTKALYAMNEIVKLYLRMEYDYDFIIRVKRRDTLDKAVLTAKDPPVMGWNTWLVSKSKQEYSEDETLDIAVSAKQF